MGGAPCASSRTRPASAGSVRIRVPASGGRVRARARTDRLRGPGPRGGARRCTPGPHPEGARSSTAQAARGEGPGGRCGREIEQKGLACEGGHDRDRRARSGAEADAAAKTTPFTGISAKNHPIHWQIRTGAPEIPRDAGPARTARAAGPGSVPAVEEEEGEEGHHLPAGEPP